LHSPKYDIGKNYLFSSLLKGHGFHGKNKQNPKGFEKSINMMELDMNEDYQ